MNNAFPGNLNFLINKLNYFKNKKMLNFSNGSNQTKLPLLLTFVGGLGFD